MSDSVAINEVGPRDGLQNLHKILGVDDRLQLIQTLINCGIRHIEVGSFVSPTAVPQMASTEQLFARLPARQDVIYSALIPNRRGYELARQAGARSLAIVLATTEAMNQRNINMSLTQALAMCCELMQRAHTDGLQGRAYVATAFACPFEGPVTPRQVESLSRRLLAAGADRVIIADTT